MKCYSFRPSHPSSRPPFHLVLKTTLMMMMMTTNTGGLPSEFFGRFVAPVTPGRVRVLKPCGAGELRDLRTLNYLEWQVVEFLEGFVAHLQASPGMEMTTQGVGLAVIAFLREQDPCGVFSVIVSMVAQPLSITEYGTPPHLIDLRVNLMDVAEAWITQFSPKAF